MAIADRYSSLVFGKKMSCLSYNLLKLLFSLNIRCKHGDDSENAKQWEISCDWGSNAYQDQDILLDAYQRCN